jgi:hypothetical protein
MKWILTGIAICLVALAAATADAASSPTWTPEASERLVKLPSSYLKKAIDRDFEGSELATALSDINTQIRLKTQTLSDLQKAVEKAEGDVKVELRHQFLAEKREFIKLMGERQEFSRKQVETKIRLFENLLGKLDSRAAGMSPAKADILKKQESARKRFESSLASVDMKLFGSAGMEETRYAKDYAKNMTAIERLVDSLKAHPMNAETEIDGETVTKEEYIRHQIADNQATLALLDQEGTILGYMAKLVALDAMALAEQVETPDLADAGRGSVEVSDTVDFFVGR